MLSLDFHCKENDGFKIVPVHSGLTGHDGHHSDPDFMNTIITGDESWVYGYDPELVIFLTIKNQYFHIFLCLKFYLFFSSPFFVIEPLYAVNSLVSYYSFQLLLPVSTNFEVFPLFILADTISKLSEVAFPQ